MSLDLSAHVPTALASATAPKKKDYRRTTNLSSNEACHPRVHALVQKWLTTVDPLCVSRYPFHPQSQQEVARRFEVEAEQVYLTAGADSAIAALLRAFCGKHGRLILAWPNYYNYERYAALEGMSPRLVDVSAGAATVAALDDAAAASGPSMVVLTNPDGYSGALVALDEIRALARRCLLRNQLLVIDETYAAYAPISHVRLVDELANVMVVHSFSKSVGMAGLRLGAVIAPPRLAATLSRTMAVNAVNGLALDFLRFAHAHEHELAQMHADVRRNRRSIEERLRQSRPEWSVPRSHGNFVFVDTKNAAQAAAVTAAFAERGITVRALADVAPYRSGVRITIRGTDEDELVLSVLRGSGRAPTELAMELKP